MRIIAFVAIALAVVAFIAGLPLQRYAQTGWHRFATDARTTWIAEHRRNLMIGVGVGTGLVLLIWSPLTGGVVVIILIVAAGLLAAIVGDLGAAAGSADDPDLEQLQPERLSAVQQAV